MDNKTFIARLAQKTSADAQTTQTLIEALAEILGTAASESDAVAIPGFGTFRPVKTPEHVETNPTDGVRTLLPPHVTIEFETGSRLRKKIQA